MMMQKLYFHIGMSKTGTSALQSFFSVNRKQLYEDGICYPELTSELKRKEKMKGFAGNAWYCLKRYLENDDSIESRRLFFDMCEKLHKIDNDILLSCEDIVKCPDENVYQDLMQQGFDLKVILFLRRQDLWLESAWNQSVKNNYNPQRLHEYIEEKRGENFLDYYKKASSIAKVIGKENLIIQIYQPDGGDITDAFLNILGIKDHSVYQKDRFHVNPSLSANYVEIVRLFNSISDSGELLEENAAILEKGKHYALQKEKVNHAPSFLSDEERLAIIKEYHESNSRLAKEFFGKEILFDESVENRGNGIDNTTIYEDIVAFLGTLVVNQYHKIKALEREVYKFRLPENIHGRVCVYGIDQLGYQLYCQLKDQKDIEDIIAVDRRHDYLQERYHIPIKDPLLIDFAHVDMIFIAVKDEDAYVAIKNYLIDQLRIDIQRIVRLTL